MPERRRRNRHAAAKPKQAGANLALGSPEVRPAGRGHLTRTAGLTFSWLGRPGHATYEER